MASIGEGKLSAKQLARMGAKQGSNETGTEKVKKAKKKKKKEESEVKRGKMFLDQFDARMREKIAMSISSRREDEGDSSYKTTSWNFEDSDVISSSEAANKVVRCSFLMCRGPDVCKSRMWRVEPWR